MNKQARVPGWNKAWGLHSNIPECCVDKYVTEGCHSMPPGSRWGYRPCWNCFNQGFKVRVKVHHCTPECVPFLESLNFSKQDINIILECNRRQKTFEEWRRKKNTERIRRFYGKRSSNYSTVTV